MLMICCDRAAARLWAGVHAMAMAPAPRWPCPSRRNSGPRAGTRRARPAPCPSLAAVRARSRSATVRASVSLAQIDQRFPLRVDGNGPERRPLGRRENAVERLFHRGNIAEAQGRAVGRAVEAVVTSARSRMPLSIAPLVVRMFRTDRTAATRIVAPAISSRHFLKTEASVRPRRTCPSGNPVQELSNQAIREAPRHRLRRSWPRSVPPRPDRRWSARSAPGSAGWIRRVPHR
jgi:hypothetical protein